MSALDSLTAAACSRGARELRAGSDPWLVTARLVRYVNTIGREYGWDPIELPSLP